MSAITLIKNQIFVPDPFSMIKKTLLPVFVALLCLSGIILQAQNSTDIQKPTLITRSAPVIEVPSIASQIADGTFKPAENIIKEVNPKHWSKNITVPGKGLPKGDDPLWQNQSRAAQTAGRGPILSFIAASPNATPTDPTGAVGPNHFVNSWNSAFRIWNKSGTPLTPEASLGTILPGTMGDPIVMYDPFADRFLITEFYSNGFDVAISKGPDPVTSGWWVYRFPTNTFPDYPKFSVWSDGYYITANKDQSSPGTSQVVFALERDKMIAGNNTAQMLGFPLTGIVVSGFYSPLGFNANGPVMPPPGNAPIVYMQDDAWSGVTTDHLKIWSVNVNWTSPASSTISSPQIINTTAFDGLFDGGSFSNLPQPSGSDIDALQATIMYMAQYRRFQTYNTVVFNFVVDLNGLDNKAGIRWYELRQTTDGAPWTIYQEGTYAQPDGHSAFCGNMCMDINGNIGMAYTSVSTTLNPSLRFTGRSASAPLGTMNIAEEVIINGTSVDPDSRYGDYAQMTIDPSDGTTFWSIGEYFSSGRKNMASTFQIAPPPLTAQFSATPTTLCAGGTVVFTDLSLASPINWTWSFPGGTPSSYSGQTPPAITYSAPGTYDVTLTVSDGITTDSEVKTGYITVNNVIANFSGTPTPVVVGNSVTFTDNSSCGPATWTWSFPGGTPSTFNGQTPPAIVYNTIGTYDVSLTVTKSAGSDTKTRTGYISVISPVFNMTNGTVTTCSGNFYDPGGSGANYGDNQNFTMTFLPGTAGSKLRFTFSSFDLESYTNCGYDYLKIYNGSSTSAALLGTWCGTTSPGTVNATGASGALTFVFHSDGSVNNPGWTAAISCISTNVPPLAEFSASSVTANVGQTITFTDQSLNFPTSWAWSFSPATVTYVGGTNAGSQNPQVQFTAAGTYTVTLTATNSYGSNARIKANYINVGTCTITFFPWTENFEAGGTIPNCWTQEMVNNSGLSWIFTTGNGSSNPAAAHSGTYDACLKDATALDHKTKLITPSINLSSLPSPQLKFWHTQAIWVNDQDQLSVFYKTSLGGTWTLLTTYTANVAAWTEETISLPNPSANYYIAFEGNAKYGYGVCLDDVQVSSSCPSILPVDVSIAASANPVCVNTGVTFTASPANSGTTPAYQWKVNGSNAGTNSPTFIYAPANNNIVTCVLTSNATCITGNPATSNAVTMIVNPLLPVSVTIAPSANPVDAGTPVTFSPTPVNGGTPAYQWYKNQMAVGSGATYTCVPENGDQVYVVMTSDLACKSGSPAISNTITMSVNTVAAIVNLNNVAFSGTQCFNATQTILVAGEGSAFTVHDGGHITLIAGQNILLYSGTLVEPGGYLYGYIAPGGPWCPMLPLPAVALNNDEKTSTSGQQLFRVYPNPTAGSIFLELDPQIAAAKCLVEISNMQGVKLLSRIMENERKVEFSLADKPAGVYLVRVISGINIVMTKIVKQP
jgi:PKD repeat protein